VRQRSGGPLFIPRDPQRSCRMTGRRRASTNAGSTPNDGCGSNIPPPCRAEEATRATPRPMPLLPPVTMPTLPFTLTPVAVPTQREAETSLPADNRQLQETAAPTFRSAKRSLARIRFRGRFCRTAREIHVRQVDGNRPMMRSGRARVG
jgi:hypothetical protein